VVLKTKASSWAGWIPSLQSLSRIQKGAARIARNISCTSNEETYIGIFKICTSQSANIQSTETEQMLAKVNQGNPRDSAYQPFLSFSDEDVAILGKNI